MQTGEAEASGESDHFINIDLYLVIGAGDDTGLLFRGRRQRIRYFAGRLLPGEYGFHFNRFW
ncbi:hypothetical protein SDC9_116223 [bioreactor metagenome]|uniref:Uncharacterized protein n=1 Tax=bioreactor metagenome TaxID=1076179 RepID=A0A645BV22_9ZZZZ